MDLSAGAGCRGNPRTNRRYRPARHVLRDKVAILLDIDIVEHFKANSDSDEFYQTQINKALRQVQPLVLSEVLEEA